MEVEVFQLFNRSRLPEQFVPRVWEYRDVVSDEFGPGDGDPRRTLRCRHSTGYLDLDRWVMDREDDENSFQIDARRLEPVVHHGVQGGVYLFGIGSNAYLGRGGMDLWNSSPRRTQDLSRRIGNEAKDGMDSRDVADYASANHGGGTGGDSADQRGNNPGSTSG